MHFDGLFGNAQLLGNVTALHSAQQQGQDLVFACRQARKPGLQSRGIDRRQARVSGRGLIDRGEQGRVFKIGGQAINSRLEAYYNAATPDGAPTWTLNWTWQFLFPK